MSIYWFWKEKKYKSEGLKQSESFDREINRHYDLNRVKSETFVKDDGTPDGRFIIWFPPPNSYQKWEEGIFKDGELHGKVTEWHKNGKKSQENTYRHGKLIGISTGWYENGKKEIEAIYKDGEPHGKVTEWYEKRGGKSSETIYNNGVKERITHFYNKKFWFDDDELIKCVFNFKDNKWNGKYIHYYRNGNKEIEGTYKDDKIVGKKTYYNENGTIKEVKDCDKGECD